MRALTALLVGAAIAALTLQAAPEEAFACSCAALPSTAEEARERLSRARSYTHAVVVGVVERRHGNDVFPAADVRRERTYAGSMPSRFTVTSSNCNGIIVDFREGERWLMEVTDREGGWEAHGCGAGVLDGRVTTRHIGDGDAWAAALDEVLPFDTRGAPTSAGGGRSEATIIATGIVAAIAVLGVAAVLLVVTRGLRAR